MDDRNDGLLQGSRDERCDQMTALEGAKWNISTLIELHLGILDHADEVNHAAIKALKKIAERNPQPISLNPVDLLGVYSGFTDIDSFIKFNTPESLQIAQDILRKSLGGGNTEFRSKAKAVVEAGKSEWFEPIRSKLSKPKEEILRKVLEGREILNRLNEKPLPSSEPVDPSQRIGPSR